jgi:glycine cleavage system H protein
VVVAANEARQDRPRLLGDDAFGAGWMLIVRPSDPAWREGLLTGPAIGPAFAAWLDAETYKDRAG